MTTQEKQKADVYFGAMFPEIAKRQLEEIKQREQLINGLSGRGSFTTDFINNQLAFESSQIEGAHMEQPIKLVKQLPVFIPQDEAPAPDPVVRYAIDPIKPSTTPVIMIDKASDEPVKIVNVPTVTPTTTGGIKVGLGGGGAPPQTADDTEAGSETGAMPKDTKTKYILYALAGFGIALAIAVALFFILKSE